MVYVLQMYFVNGGGFCYIIFVGIYIQDDNFVIIIFIDDLGNMIVGDGGLDILEKEDELIFIVFLDSQVLNDGDFYSLYQVVLVQCNKLQDCFVIMDIKMDSVIVFFFFWNGIGIIVLKYGGVYYLFLEMIFDYCYVDVDVEVEYICNLVFNLLNISVDMFDVELLNIVIEIIVVDVIGGWIIILVEVVIVIVGMVLDKCIVIGNFGDNDLIFLIGYLEIV